MLDFRGPFRLYRGMPGRDGAQSAAERSAARQRREGCGLSDRAKPGLPRHWPRPSARCSSRRNLSTGDNTGYSAQRGCADPKGITPEARPWATFAKRSDCRLKMPWHRYPAQPHVAHPHPEALDGPQGSHGWPAPLAGSRHWRPPGGSARLGRWAFSEVEAIADKYAQLFDSPTDRAEEIAAPVRVIAALSDDDVPRERVERALARQLAAFAPAPSPRDCRSSWRAFARCSPTKLWRRALP